VVETDFPPGTENGTTEICGIGAADPDGVAFRRRMLLTKARIRVWRIAAQDGRFIAATGV
jgi:hypothetical protein